MITCDTCGVESEKLQPVPKRPPTPFETVALCPACYGKREGIIQDQLDSFLGAYCNTCGERHPVGECQDDEADNGRYSYA